MARRCEIYDPGIDAWHILWSDPLRQVYTRQIGRKRGKDIVQDGQDDGDPLRWSFTEITPIPSTGSASARSTADHMAAARRILRPPGRCSVTTKESLMLDHVSIESAISPGQDASTMPRSRLSASTCLSEERPRLAMDAMP
jgi:hypothetical protein